MLAEAIAYYHDLLDLETAQATQARLTEELHARDLFFGDRPLVSVLRPRFLTAEQNELFRSACSLVATAARKIATAALTDSGLRAGLGLTTGEERLIAMHPGYDEPSAHSRMDTFLTVDGETLQFVEYNAESPAAIAYQDELSDLFFELPAMQRFAERYTVQALPARNRLLDTLLTAWAAFGSARTPNIAIVDWKDLPTRSEFVLFQRFVQAHGLDATICTPDDLTYHDGQLYAKRADAPGEIPIDLIYKRVLTAELLMHYGDAIFEHPLVHAYAAGKLCLVNSFHAKLLHKKALFSLLTDDTLQSMFTAEEQTAIARHVPWTRNVIDGTTTYAGKAIDLLDFIRTNKERLLLKPNDEYGGKGIVIGWETDTAEWERAIADALQSPFIVQERVTIAYEDYPSLVDGAVQIGRRLVDTDPFLFGTDVQGCLVRLSTVTLLNVTAGGGSTVPAFVIEPR
jgi:uncharacterized circularly permuted ATP-grasp superfamily protein